MPVELTRSFLTVILPGVVATSPWILLLIAMNTSMQELYETFEFPFHVLAFSLAVLLGAVIECIGSEVETKWDKMKGKESEPEGINCWVSKDWHGYLHRSFGESEPVIYRYLSRKVTTLYFELGMMFAAPISTIGIGALIGTHTEGSVGIGVFIGVVAVLMFGLFYRFAKDTHNVLCVTRYRYMQVP